MKMYRLHHNGKMINFFDSLEQVAQTIKEEIKKHEDLHPKKIMNVQEENRTVIIYQYWTLYTEMFMIEELER